MCVWQLKGHPLLLLKNGMNTVVVPGLFLRKCNGYMNNYRIHALGEEYFKKSRIINVAFIYIHTKVSKHSLFEVLDILICCALQLSRETFLVCSFCSYLRA